MINSSTYNYFNSQETPFYYYDMELLENSLISIKKEAAQYNYHVHYAIKANANPRILSLIQSYGFGADCVSGNEIKRSIENGFSADKIVYAGVGKSDREIELALDFDIFVSIVNPFQRSRSLKKLLNRKIKLLISLYE